MLTYDAVICLGADLDFELRRCSKHIAVLMDGARIVNVFANKYAFHAEELAVTEYHKQKQKIKKPKIFIVRKSPENRLSRPCCHCCLLLRRFPQIRVFYSGINGEFIEETKFDACHISHRRQEMGFCRRKVT